MASSYSDAIPGTSSGDAKPPTTPSSLVEVTSDQLRCESEREPCKNAEHLEFNGCGVVSGDSWRKLLLLKSEVERMTLEKQRFMAFLMDTAAKLMISLPAKFEDGEISDELLAGMSVQLHTVLLEFNENKRKMREVEDLVMCFQYGQSSNDADSPPSTNENNTIQQSSPLTASEPAATTVAQNYNSLRAPMECIAGPSYYPIIRKLYTSPAEQKSELLRSIPTSYTIWTQNDATNSEQCLSAVPTSSSAKHATPSSVTQNSYPGVYSVPVEDVTPPGASKTPNYILHNYITEMTSNPGISRENVPEGETTSHIADQPEEDYQVVDDSSIEEISTQKRTISKSKRYTRFVKTDKPHGRVKKKCTFWCECGIGYRSMQGLNNHVAKMTKEWKHKCDSCKQRFFYEHEFKRHLLGTDCGKTSSTKQKKPNQVPAKQPESLQRSEESKKLHMTFLETEGMDAFEISLEDGTFQCKCCKTKYKKQSGMKYHIKSNTEEWKFKCDKCDSKFFTKAGVRKHMYQSHKVSQLPSDLIFSCTKCGLCFRKHKELLLHKGTAHSVDDSACGASETVASTSFQETLDLCNESSADKEPTASPVGELVTELPHRKRLGTHQGQHSIDSEPTNLPPIPKSFSDKPGHQNKGRKCKKEQVNKTHLLRNSGNIPRVALHACSRCNASFNRLVKLQVHMKTH